MSFGLLKTNKSVWIYNHITNTNTESSPIELWYCSRLTFVSDNLYNFHVWVFSTYVLEHNIHKSRFNIPKWSPRLLQGLNVGFTRMNITLFGLKLNPITGSISPQLRVAYNYSFKNILINE